MAKVATKPAAQFLLMPASKLCEDVAAFLSCAGKDPFGEGGSFSFFRLKGAPHVSGLG